MDLTPPSDPAPAPAPDHDEPDPQHCLNLESEDDRPDEPEDHPRVPVHYVLGTNVLQSDLDR